jgi:Flp pilus assembly pilin Flp
MKCVIRFLRDERGQGTTEYILILSISVGLFLIVSKNLIKPAIDIMQRAISGSFDRMLFGADLHRLRVR